MATQSTWDTHPKMKQILLVLVCACAVVPLWALPDGAPVEACGDLTPDHFVPPQSSSPPFTLSVQRQGGLFLVTLAKSGGSQFRGFVMQARNAAGQITGRFAVTDPFSSQVLSCPGGDDADNSVTHVENDLKDSVTVAFYPPEGSDGSGITIKASVVVFLLEFWTGLETG